MDDDTRRKAGMARRREVLGDAHVDRAEARKTAFTADFQDFITRVAWGELWQRPGLDRRTRRMLTIVLMVALARAEEFRMHLRAALASGDLSADDVKELLMHCAVYAGVPAANAAFADAQEVLSSLEEAPPA